MLRDQSPDDIPTYLHDYIPNYMTCKALASKADPRYSVFKSALLAQEDLIRTEIEPRQIREPQFVIGFMEEEEY